GVGVVAAGHVVERPVRFDVAQRGAARLRQPRQRADLVNAVLEDLLSGSGKLASAEVLPVRKDRMSADRDAMPHRLGNGGDGGGRVAGVSTAGDVGGADERHQVAVEGTAFAQVAVEVDYPGAHGICHAIFVDGGLRTGYHG